MGSPPAGVRNLFRAALVIFVITVVIGILNGIDVWEPPRNTLLTHVHAGTLGWVTLGVFGGAIWMLGADDQRSASRMATFSVISLALYVAAFWSVDLTTTSVQRPIGGTLAFVAMVWVFVWAVRQMRGKQWDVARLGMILALGFLVIGAIFGVLLGLQLADIEIVDPANADQLYEAHPGAMVAGFVLLAGLALIEWAVPGRRVPTLSESKTGVTQMLLLFTAGLLFVAGSLFAVEPLLQVAGAMQLLGALFLIGRFRRELAPSQWGGDVVNRYVRMAILGLVLAVILIVYLISQVSTGTDFAELTPVLLAFDHLNFIMVMTNLIFAMMLTASMVSDSVSRLLFWGINIGVAGFAVGLITESATVKRVFTPILGLALLYGIYVFFRAPERESVTA